MLYYIKHKITLMQKVEVTENYVHILHSIFTQYLVEPPLAWHTTSMERGKGVISL